MAAIDDLINQIPNKALRDRIKKETDRLQHNKKFGLVFEEHLPECTPLYGVKIKVGSKVAVKGKSINKIFKVTNINNEIVTCVRLGQKKEIKYSLSKLVSVAEFGDPIYPYLKKMDIISTAPQSKVWHELIEADNYHALQLLDYVYANKVDCIYIDPPYNTGATDWKYNNNYVNKDDSYRHSKWLTFMEDRLKLAKKILNPDTGVLIVTIDEHEMHRLRLLIEQMFPNAFIQMATDVINPKGVAQNHLSRVEEYVIFVFMPNAKMSKWKDNMLTDDSSKTVKVQWASLLRRGNNSMRVDRPNSFYPILVDEKNNRVVRAGKTLPLHDHPNLTERIDGYKVAWPIRTDLSEGRWSVNPDTLNQLIKDGYISLGKYDKKRQTWAIKYLFKKQREQIKNGEIKVVSFNKKENHVEVKYDTNKASQLVKTVWNRKSHDGGTYGSSLLKKLFGDKRFTFPKSLYSVFDEIGMIVADKPNAIVLDFFAGSGTTLHAVNLLNAEDNGNRKCIMITNNEVSDKEAERLHKRGFHPGDLEWEKWGIAHYVTWPRTVCSINGKNIKDKPLKGTYGTYHTEYISDPKHKGDYKQIKVSDNPRLSNMKMADGFKSNVIYFKLGFLDKNSVALGTQFKKLLPVLWMKANGIGKCPEIQDQKIKSSYVFTKNHFAVLLDEKAYPSFKEKVNNNKAIETVFIVTDSDNGYHEMISQLNTRNTYQLYKDYLDNFRINAKG